MATHFMSSFRKGHAEVPVEDEFMYPLNNTNATHHAQIPGKEVGTETKPIDSSDSGSAEIVSNEVQHGIEKIEATTAIWSKTTLIVAYGFIFLIYFINSLQQGIANTLNTYVTSAFQGHSLTAVTGVMSGLIAGLFKLPLAKILDIWGRPQGFLLMVVLQVIGLSMMAACKNVKTYAAAQVFYWIGHNGMGYTLDVFISDTSSLKNRGLMYAFASSPYIITTWASGPAAQSFVDGIGFRWGFGTFCIVTPVMCMPLFMLFTWNYRKAKKAGLASSRQSSRTLIQSTKHYAIEFDIIGLLLLTAGLALLLFSLALYSYQKDRWRSSVTLGMLNGGIVTLIAFGIYEKHFAPKTFIPWELLTDRTVLGAYVLSSVLFVEFYIWESFFFSFLQVVNNLSITNATYVANIYMIGSCLWGIITGVVIRYTGRFKHLALFFGFPVTVLGVALMIHFRQPETNIGYIIMCQLFIAMAGGSLVICEQIAALAATTHQYVAVVLAVEGMFASIGGAIGQAIAAAIWTSVFPKMLAKYLPPKSQGKMMDIYNDLNVQLSYPVGSPTRNAIIKAYGDAQKIMIISSTSVLALALIAICCWRDIRIKDFKQVKGRVV